MKDSYEEVSSDSSYRVESDDEYHAVHWSAERRLSQAVPDMPPSPSESEGSFHSDPMDPPTPPLASSQPPVASTTTTTAVDTKPVTASSWMEQFAQRDDAHSTTPPPPPLPPEPLAVEEEAPLSEDDDAPTRRLRSGASIHRRPVSLPLPPQLPASHSDTTSTPPLERKEATASHGGLSPVPAPPVLPGPVSPNLSLSVAALGLPPAVPRLALPNSDDSPGTPTSTGSAATVTTLPVPSVIVPRRLSEGDTPAEAAVDPRAASFTAATLTMDNAALSQQFSQSMAVGTVPAKRARTGAMAFALRRSATSKPKDTLHTVTEDSIEGYLQKRGDGILKTYKQRYFKVEGTLLAYYLHKGLAEEATIGTINLQGAVIDVDETDACSFSLSGPYTKRRFDLKAATPEERESWVTGLRKVASPAAVPDT
eukprot:NODE_1317_length_1381_cov_30.698565_g1305_i0.p1 GENE.NODE_1317_length_1381_cov_30.698565_g1305_i0~~NODE_1317_length_1381_cov_30.698565_g1305_i0.p1  ORF type:complete len:438 (-),score=74.98 NODE_1317_length_1381_cov_30.698565_g1305_i0:68-1339(-)